MFKTTMLYLGRNKIRTMLFFLMIGFVLWGEMIGLLLNSIAIQAKKDAFSYNGAALFIYDENLNLTKENYEKIKKMEHVLGVGNWKEIVVQPLDTNNVKEHIGITPKTDVRGMADKMVILAHMDTQMYQLFRWEKSVSIIDGDFPNNENKGILIEKRYADLNHLKIGDTISYTVTQTEKTINLEICGIYKVDSEFEILEDNQEGTSVYIHSPYNTIFVDYDYIIELLEFEYSAKTGGEIYIDDASNLQQVADNLHAMLGQEVSIYDNTTTYLEEECRIVGLMEKTSTLICIFVLCIGEIIILIVFSLCANQYKKETGLFLILGKSKYWCLGRYLFITAFYTIGGFIFGIIIYQLSSEIMCELINNISMNIINNSQFKATGGYLTPNLGQGFQIAINKNMLFSNSNILTLIKITLSSWLISSLLPLHSVFSTRPKLLLNSNN